MPTLTISYTTDAERLAYEQAISFVTQMHQVAQSAPVGTVIDACETLALSQGRELLNDTLQKAVSNRIETVEQKGGRRARVRAQRRATVRANNFNGAHGRHHSPLTSARKSP